MSELRNIAVIGGGLMGAGIAQVFAVAGYQVNVFEPIDAARASLLERVTQNLKLLRSDTSIVERIEVLTDFQEAVAEVDYITEAAPEKLEIKRSIFSDLELFAPREAILASNTSVIPISQIADGLASADRMVGTHWWNPPYLVPLVEVVQGDGTAKETIDKTMALLSRIGKEPAHIQKDVPGFVANRLQHALWREAIAMVADGVCDAETLDKCVKNSFGLRLPVLGPLENADMVGLDLTLDIHKTIIPELDRSEGPNVLLRKLVEQNQLGFKTGHGFREWTESQMAHLRENLIEHLVECETD